MTIVSATTAKNEFGRILESAIRGTPVGIERRKETVAVLISKATYDSLMAQRQASLDKVRAHYDEMFERMQQPEQGEAMMRAFHSTPEELGRTAVKMARKRAQ